jgi:methylated-DNA-[protein]-cysteine S-methyltransferase
MTACEPSPVLVTELATPIGPLSLLARDGVLVAAGFTADPATLAARLHPSVAGELLPARPGALTALVKPLEAYFGGDLAALGDIPVHQPGGPSRQKLWAQPGPGSHARRGPRVPPAPST